MTINTVIQAVKTAFEAEHEGVNIYAGRVADMATPFIFVEPEKAELRHSLSADVYGMAYHVKITCVVSSHFDAVESARDAVDAMIISSIRSLFSLGEGMHYASIGTTEVEYYESFNESEKVTVAEYTARIGIE